MWLPAESSDSPGQSHIIAIAIRSAKCITRQRSWTGLRPGHDHSPIHPTGQRHPNRLPITEIPRKNSSKRFLKLVIELGLAKQLLALPVLSPEIDLLAEPLLRAKSPSGTRRQEGNAGEKRAVLENATARNKL